MQAHRLLIKHIRVGFSAVVPNGNYGDCHRALVPFGLKWGRGVLVHGEGYLEAITGDYGSSHSSLKKELASDEISYGTFYYGFDGSTKTLYLDYASDRTFDFNDGPVLEAIMDAIRDQPGPLRDYELDRQA
jgi:hypothetical protein